VPNLQLPYRKSNLPYEAPAHLLFVDDDDDYREVIAAELGDQGFRVTEFSESSGLVDYFSEGHSADAILLDWNLPTVSGIELVSLLKSRGVQTPVIMLTGMPGSHYEIEALDRGAVDFVDKAKGVSVLARRVRLTIAAREESEYSVRSRDRLGCGALVLRPQVSRAYWLGHELDLTVTEFNIVRKLISNVGEHVTYREIYDCVHHCGFIAGSGEDGYRTNVRSTIKRIRNKFRGVDQDFTEIENFPAFGYRWRKPATGS